MPIELGTVVAPSGVLLIVDPGYLKMWTHDGAPVLPEGILSGPGATATANGAVDLAIIGRDAEKVGRTLDRQWDPRFIFDYPRHAVEELAGRIAEIAAADGLDARLEVLPERVSHRRRIDLALELGRNAGEIIFYGIWAAVIGDVPPGTLRVLGEPMPPGDPDENRLRRIVIVARETLVARSERVAHVGVDWARLLAVDVEAVRGWRDSEPLDGKADFAFWGRDAEAIAARVGAEPLDDGVYGWRDLRVEEAAARGTHVAELKEQEALQCGTDFRPHSHHYQLMEQVRRSPTESGTVALGEARACGFMTSWGDGIFEVHRDLDAAGRLVQVRIELGTEQRQRLMRQLELRWFTSALVSRKVLDDKEPVRFMYREAPDREGDSGWRMMTGLEDEEYNSDPQNIAVVRLSEFADMDKSVDALLDEPPGSVFERVPGEVAFKRVTDWVPSGD